MNPSARHIGRSLSIISVMKVSIMKGCLVFDLCVSGLFPMGTNCAPFLADIFLYSYEAEFIQSLLLAGKKQ